MIKYHVTYYHLDTDIDIIPLEEDYGYVIANNAEEAKIIAVRAKYPHMMHNDDLTWVIGCLTANAIL